MRRKLSVRTFVFSCTSHIYQCQSQELCASWKNSARWYVNANPIRFGQNPRKPRVTCGGDVPIGHWWPQFIPDHRSSVWGNKVVCTNQKLMTYRNRPVLWDCRLKVYKNRNQKRDAFVEIAVSFGVSKEEVEGK